MYSTVPQSPVVVPGWPKTPERWQSELYADLSTDQPPTYSVGSEFEAKGPKSRTYTEIRYECWKLINAMLMQAEDFERSRQQGKGIAASDPGGRIVRKPGLIQPAIPHSSHLAAELNIHKRNIEEENSVEWTEESWRQRIINLRSRDYKPPPV